MRKEKLRIWRKEKNMLSTAQNLVLKKYCISHLVFPLSAKTISYSTAFKSQQELPKKYKRTKGYAEFDRDSKSLVHGKLTKTRKPAAEMTMGEIHRKETDLMFSYSHDSVKSTPRGELISEANKIASRPRGVLISEFPEAILVSKKERKSKVTKQSKESTTKKVPEKVWDTKIEFNAKDKAFTKTDNSKKLNDKSHTLKTKESAKKIVFKRNAKEEQTIQTDNLILRTNPSNPKEVNRAEIRSQLAVEREEEKKNTAKRFFPLLEDSKINEYMLDQMMKYPLLPSDVIAKNQDSGNFYDGIELKIANELLFEKFNPDALSKIPPVTSIINVATAEENRENLIKWQIDKIEELGFDGYKASNNRIKKRGNDFHKATEKLLKGEQLDTPNLNPDIVNNIDTIKKVLEAEFKNEMVLVEENLLHSKLSYSGRFDCMGYYKDTLCLIDWKRTDEPKRELRSLYDAPVQIAAYIGAFLNDDRFLELRKEKKLENGLIINFSESGEVNYHLLSYQQIEFYWYRWMSLLRRFWYYVLQQKNGL